MTHVRILLIVLVLGVNAGSAFAQTPRATGPFSGLFGGRGSSTQSLDLRGSLFGASQKTSFPDDVGPSSIDPRFNQCSLFSGASAALSYQYVRGAGGSSFFVGGRGSISQSSLLPDLFPYEFGGGTGVSTRLTRRIGFSAQADAAYSPYYGFSLLESGFSSEIGFGQDPTLVGQNFGFAALDQPTIFYGGGFGVTADLTRRTSLSASGDYRETRLVGNPLGSIRTIGGFLTARHQLFRGLGVRVGYGQYVSESDAPGAERFTDHRIDAGIDFADGGGGSLSLGRRTTVTFNGSLGIARDLNTWQFRLNGNAGITHGIGRTWSSSANYVRSVGLVTGFGGRPILSDEVQSQIGGLLTPRLSWTSAASWLRGEIGYDSAGGSFSTYSATSGIQLALFTGLGLYAQYGYFSYDVPSGSTTLPFLSKFSRQTFSVGASAFVPIFSTGRRSRDSR